MDKQSLKQLVWLSQLGLSLIAPPILCLLLGVWLADLFCFGGWFVLLLLLFGLGGSVANGLAFYRMTQKKAEKDPKQKFFNDHH